MVVDLQIQASLFVIIHSTWVTNLWRDSFENFRQNQTCKRTLIHWNPYKVSLEIFQQWFYTIQWSTTNKVSASFLLTIHSWYLLHLYCLPIKIQFIIISHQPSHHPSLETHIQTHNNLIIRTLRKTNRH